MVLADAVPVVVLPWPFWFWYAVLIGAFIACVLAAVIATVKNRRKERRGFEVITKPKEMKE